MSILQFLTPLGLKGVFVFAVIFSISGAIFLYPHGANAGFFAFLKNLWGGEAENQTASIFNSQTLPLLQAPLNEDPTAGTGGAEIVYIAGNAILAQTGPEGSIADINEQKPDKISIYVVREDDNLSQIAELFGVSINTIIWANDIKRGDLIKPGQVLVILPVTGIQHTVEKGDTIASIAKKYKGDIEEIIQFNGLPAEGGLATGQVIIIPNGEGEPILTYSTSRGTVRGGGPSYIGYYLRPISGGRKSQGLHGYNAVDLATSCGEPVYASASGDVLVARSYGWNGGYGKYLAIKHGNGTQTLYAHLSSIIVGYGWHVVQGQVIGYVGSTGLSTGCHVHFEIRGAANPF